MSRKRRWAWCVLAGALLVHAGLLWIYHVPSAKMPWGDEAHFLNIAEARIEGSPRPIHPFYSRYYPRWVATWLAIGGGSILPLQLAQTALLILCAFLLRDITLAAGGNDTAATAAAFLMIGYPPLVAYAHYVWPEILHMALLLIAVWVLVMRKRHGAWLVLLGVSLGLALATKYFLWPFLPVLLLPLALEAPRRRGLARAGLTLLIALVIVAPALGSNARRFGVSGVLDSATFNLWVGLNDVARRNFENDVIFDELLRYDDGPPDHSQRRAELAARTKTLVRERGLLRVLAAQAGRQYFRLLDKDSFLTDQLPGGVLAERGVGYADPPAWLSGTLRALSYGLYALVLVGAVAGLTYRCLRKGTASRLVEAFLAYNALLFLVVHVKTRYRIQLLPFLFLLAAIGAVSIVSQLRNRSAADPPARHDRWMLIGTTLSAALLLFLAFGGSAFR